MKTNVLIISLTKLSKAIVESMKVIHLEVVDEKFYGEYHIFPKEKEKQTSHTISPKPQKEQFVLPTMSCKKSKNIGKTPKSSIDIEIDLSDKFQETKPKKPVKNLRQTVQKKAFRNETKEPTLCQQISFIEEVEKVKNQMDIEFRLKPKMSQTDFQQTLMNMSAKLQDMAMDKIKNFNLKILQASNIDTLSPAKMSHYLVQILEESGLYGSGNAISSSNSQQNLSAISKRSIQSSQIGDNSRNSLKKQAGKDFFTDPEDQIMPTKTKNKKLLLNEIGASKAIEQDEIATKNLNPRTKIVRQYKDKIKQQEKVKLKLNALSLAESALQSKKENIQGFYFRDNVPWVKFKLTESDSIWKIAFYSCTLFKEFHPKDYHEITDVNKTLIKEMDTARTNEWRTDYNHWMTTSRTIKECMYLADSHPSPRNEENQAEFTKEYEKTKKKMEILIKEAAKAKTIELQINETNPDKEGEEKIYTLVRAKKQNSARMGAHEMEIEGSEEMKINMAVMGEDRK